jgi:DNA-binding transcriptional ArsR family regulator
LLPVCSKEIHTPAFQLNLNACDSSDYQFFFATWLAGSNLYRNIAMLLFKMGATNTIHYTDKQNEIATLAKALGHPARIAILEYLIKVDTCICGDIVNVLPLAQPTVSQHLKELKNAGLIKGSIEGNAICYCIDTKALTKLQNYFANISAKLTKKKNNCC